VLLRVLAAPPAVAHLVIPCQDRFGLQEFHAAMLQSFQVEVRKLENTTLFPGLQFSWYRLQKRS
jgi:hypothetical protein